jgi:hypothetical protein
MNHPLPLLAASAWLGVLLLRLVQARPQSSSSCPFAWQLQGQALALGQIQYLLSFLVAVRAWHSICTACALVAAAAVGPQVCYTQPRLHSVTEALLRDVCCHDWVNLHYKASHEGFPNVAAVRHC